MRNLLHRFGADRRGSIAIYMAAAVLPLTLLIGAATDLRRVETERARVQDASDAAVLAAARAYWTGGRTPPQKRRAAEIAAERALAANLAEGAVLGRGAPPPGLSAFDWKLERRGKGEMILAIRSEVPLAFGGLFRMSDVPFRTRSAATTGDIKRVEVALVLDNTGSMRDLDKIGVLRNATVRLVDQLENATALNPDQRDALKIALVPFSMTVRLPSPASYQDQAWIEWEPSADTYLGLHSGERRSRFTDADPWDGCVEVRPSAGNHDIAEGVNGGRLNRYVPFVQPAGAPNRKCEVQPIHRLTADTDAIKTAARAMGAAHNTNIPLGLVWGWHAIAPRSAGGPFGDGQPYGREDTLKAIVLMTDGMNRINGGELPQGGEYSGVGVPSQGRIGGVTPTSNTDQRAAALDARLAALCEAIKDREVVLYTVRLMEGPEPVLKTCASGAQRYFFVRQPEDLDDAFQAIAGDIIQVRLTQ